MKIFKTFHLKIIIFTAVKYCCILHGRVCVMGYAIDEVFMTVSSWSSGPHFFSYIAETANSDVRKKTS